MLVNTQYHGVVKVEITDSRLLEPQGQGLIGSAKLNITLKTSLVEIVLFSASSVAMPQLVLFEEKKRKSGYIPLAERTGIHRIQSIEVKNHKYETKWSELVIRTEDGIVKIVLFNDNNGVAAEGVIYNGKQEKAA
jgi:hypothetical protein